MKNKIACILIVTTLSGCDELSCNKKEKSEADFYNSILEENKRVETLQSVLPIISDLLEGLKKAENENKPVLLYFTGYAVVNARRIESELLFKNMTVYNAMRDHYINVWLYTDDRPNNRKWLKYQKERFNTDFQPYFIILNFKGDPISKGLNYSDAIDHLETELLKHVKN